MADSIRNRLAILIVLAVIWTSGMTAGTADAQWAFEVLDPPVEAGWAHFSLSRDGRDMGCLLGGSVYWWTADEGYRFLGTADPAMGSVGMSADGRALAAGRKGEPGSVPTIWYDDGRIIDLGNLVPDCPQDPSPQWSCDVSSGGSVVVGMTTDCRWEKGFQWTADAGLRFLEGDEESNSTATAVSADGLTVVGYSEHPGEGYHRPILWREGSRPSLFLGESRRGAALAVSLNGRIVVGQADLGGLTPQAFTWTEGRDPISLGTLRGRATDPSLAHAVSNDGRVVGWSGDSLWGEQEAFVWTAGKGMMAVSQLLEDNGVEVPAGLILTSALDISGDGTTVVGVGRDGDWNPRFWRVHLGESLDPPPLTGSVPRITSSPDTTRPDSLDAFHSEFLHPFPFGKRRYAPFQ